MSIQVIFPKYHWGLEHESHIFLAGPVRNAPPWHEEAIETLNRLSPHEGVITEYLPKEFIAVCSPKRENEFSEEFLGNRFSSEGKDLRFTRQREWEWELQLKASEEGGILFWLPQEGQKVFQEKAYGATTQTELGYWLGRASLDESLRIAIGSDGQYNHELETLEYDILRLAPHIPRFWTLRGLCQQGVTWIRDPLVRKKKSRKR